ncbi:MAG: hypothetical protein WC635_05430 [Bacteriovorax sp.]
MRKFFYYAIQLLVISRLYSGIVQRDLFIAVQSFTAIIALYFTYRLINSVLAPTETELLKADGGTSEDLNSNEKKTVLLTTLFNPVVSGAFYYYSWKNKFPKKAKQSNKYSWGMFALIIAIYLPFIVMKTNQIMNAGDKTSQQPISQNARWAFKRACDEGSLSSCDTLVEISKK